MGPPDEDELGLVELGHQDLLKEVERLRDQVAKHNERWTTEGWERRRAAQTDEYHLNQAIYQAQIEVAKASVERSYRAAEFVRNAAAAIVTLYTGILGLTFASTADARVGPLPARGLLAAVFLAAAIVLSTAFVALLQRPRPLDPPKPTSVLRLQQDRRLKAFVEWTTGNSLQRAFLLHASVISLGWGTAFLPVPFLAVFEGNVAWWAAAVGSISTCVVPIATTRPLRNSAAAGRIEPRRVR